MQRRFLVLPAAVVVLVGCVSLGFGKVEIEGAEYHPARARKLRGSVLPIESLEFWVWGFDSIPDELFDNTPFEEMEDVLKEELAITAGPESIAEVRRRAVKRDNSTIKTIIAQVPDVESPSIAMHIDLGPITEDLSGADMSYRVVVGSLIRVSGSRTVPLRHNEIYRQDVKAFFEFALEDLRSKIREVRVKAGEIPG